MLEDLTHEDFLARVGETFAAVAPEGGPRSFTLARVDTLTGPPDGGRTPFSLVFEDAAPERLAQQTVEVSHPDLGDFPLFVVPIAVGPEGRGVLYEAVFT